MRNKIFLFLLLTCTQKSFSAIPGIKQDKIARTITITVPDKKLSIVIDYSKGCMIKQLNIQGNNVLSSAGVYTGIQISNRTFTSLAGNVKVTTAKDAVILKDIRYGDSSITVNETWKFKLTGAKVSWDITREYSSSGELEDMFFPKWNFADLSVWKAGILDNGGMVWCKYLKQINDTYGVHTGGVTFYNATSGDALKITTVGNNVAAKYSHSENNEFTCTQLITDSVLSQRYNLSRFVSERSNIFAPFSIKKGTTTAHIELQYEDYFSRYSRGTLTEIDADAVRELLNTTARYGVVDNNIIGGNGWLTNWKCLHEPFFAQIAMAVDDENYTRNMSATLDQERDQAILRDGRVLSRWHNVPGDEIPGTYNAKTGYYEAMWGYTIDSQTGYIINTAEQFDLNGDTTWLKSHQESCEKALAWLINRDANHNGIFEMMNNNIAENTASDWLDIVWASYENAFVNAQMYEALKLWAGCEKVLGNPQKSAFYTATAARLKTAFNKPVDEGGFWSPAKKQYVYWRDDDGSVHGDNLVTPVNFAAIAFGICDDAQRIGQVLDQVEQRTTNEHLFHWPLCFDSFKKEEVSPGNWPFPKYENGDIFPSWGYLGIRAYAGYDKTIALKYIRNILEQYRKDGLSSQRYSRSTQLGLGDDILSGICTSITALYRDIYGIRPKWNRMGLEPNLSGSLNGTDFFYKLRGVNYQIKLTQADYEMHTHTFSVKSKESFGASMTSNLLTYYHHNQDSALLQIKGTPGRSIKLAMHSWDTKEISWSMTSSDKYIFTIKGLHPASNCLLLVNDVPQHMKTTKDGMLTIASKSPGRFLVRYEN
jgi:hypothetical protein